MAIANDHYNVLGSARRVVLLVKGSAMPAQGVCRALLVGTAGTANVKDGDGNTCTNIPLQVGYNPIIITSLDAGGTASDIWALY